MEKVTVSAPMGITVPVGAVIGALGEDQVRRRARRLEEMKRERYRVLEPVMFKLGECFEIDETSVLGRDMWTQVESDGGPVARKKAKAIAKVKEKASAKAKADADAKAKAAADAKAKSGLI